MRCAGLIHEDGVPAVAGGRVVLEEFGEGEAVLVGGVCFVGEEGEGNGHGAGGDEGWDGDEGA